MIDYTKAKIGGFNLKWKGSEILFMNRIKRKFKVTDPIEKRKQDFNVIWYTWCNNQKGHYRVHCRLDGVYYDFPFFSFPSNMGHYY